MSDKDDKDIIIGALRRELTIARGLQASADTRARAFADAYDVVFGMVCDARRLCCGPWPWVSKARILAALEGKDGKQ